MQLNALRIADDLVDFLANHPVLSARVHSVFPHAANVLVGDDTLVTLINQNDLPPMGLAVDSNSSFTQLFKIGDEMLLTSADFAAADGSFLITLQGAEVWQTLVSDGLAPRSSGEVARINLRLMGWLAKQPALGLLPLLPWLTGTPPNSGQPTDNPYSRFIAQDLEAFTSAIFLNDWELALDLTDKLIGFGMGSTPSCDDFLAAYLAVLTIADARHPGQYPWIRGFNRAVANKAKHRTTLISVNMLRHAAQGKLSWSHQQLVQNCLFKTQNDLFLSASQVIQHGASSGGDFMLGLVCALEWYRHQKVELTRKGESAQVVSTQSQPVPMI